MTVLKQSRLAVAAMMTAILAATLTAQIAPGQGATNGAAGSVTNAKRVVVVSLEDRKLALVEDGMVMKTYTVAVGKPSTPSPEGTFKIERRVMNPTYTHNGRTVPPGPNNPVGSRWMGLNLSGYGIHGTNEPNSIGKAASHGCIRMGKSDVEELFRLVAVGDTVELIGKRNEETAQLFDAAPTAQPSPQTAMVSTASVPVAMVAPQSATASMNKGTFTSAVMTIAAKVSGSM